MIFLALPTSYRTKLVYFCVFLCFFLSACCKKEDLFEKYALHLPEGIEIFTETDFIKTLPYADSQVQRAVLQAARTKEMSFFAEFYELKGEFKIYSPEEIEKAEWSVRPSGAHFRHQQLILQNETWSRTVIFFQKDNFAFYGSFLEKTPLNLSMIMPHIY